jgi:hypothetical protein
LNVALYNFLEINIVVIAKPVLQNFTGLWFSLCFLIKQKNHQNDNLNG